MMVFIPPALLKFFLSSTKEMEKSSSLRYGFLLVFLVLLPGCTKADSEIKEVTDPTSNVNLSPFDQWRSAYECLQNMSSNCQGNYSLTERGWVNLTSNDTVPYCTTTGCADHSRVVLECISLVKRDFKFENGATVKDIYDTINDGCRSNFTGITKISGNARKINVGKTIIFISVLATWLVLIT